MLAQSPGAVRAAYHLKRAHVQRENLAGECLHIAPADALTNRVDQVHDRKLMMGWSLLAATTKKRTFEA